MYPALYETHTVAPSSAQYLVSAVSSHSEKFVTSSIGAKRGIVVSIAADASPQQDESLAYRRGKTQAARKIKSKKRTPNYIMPTYII